MKNQLLLLSLAIVCALSCGENEIEDPDQSAFGYEYFQVDVGHEWIYNVDSVLIGQGGLGNIESSSQVRERITDLISDEDGEKTYRLERSHRRNDSTTWNVTDIWTIATTDERVTKTIENLTFVKMVFPATDGVRWDGNVFFNDEESFPVAQENLKIYQNWDYEVQSRDVPMKVGEIDYDNVLRVNHIDDETQISRRFSYEKYAKDVGLVERYMEIFDSQNRIDSEPWVDSAEKGFFLHQTLVSFTKN